MSDVMTQAIIGMPYELAMSDELSRLQFHSRAQELLADYAALEAELVRMAAQRDAILQQARAWAGEAKTQRSTVLEVGEILGGIPDWGPISAGVEAMAAENAKLRAGQESLLLNLAEQKRQAVEYREMWAKAAERAFAQSSDLSFLAEYIVGREYGTALPNYEALGRYPLDVAEAALAAPSAPKANPVKVQMLEALEELLAVVEQYDLPLSDPERIAARAAIAAARQEGGKV